MKNIFIEIWNDEAEMFTEELHEKEIQGDLYARMGQPVDVVKKPNYKFVPESVADAMKFIHVYHEWELVVYVDGDCCLDWS